VVTDKINIDININTALRWGEGRGKGAGVKKMPYTAEWQGRFLLVDMLAFQNIIPRNYFVSAQVCTKFNFSL
jgi:hypothetical protein